MLKMTLLNENSNNSVEITKNSQVAIAGKAIDGQTQQAISGATVEIIEMPQKFRDRLALKALQYGARWAKLQTRPDRQLTNRDGSFHFVDLPPGNYSLAGFIPGIDSQYGVGDFTVKEEEASGRTITVVDNLNLLPVRVRGKVKDEDNPDRAVTRTAT